MLDRGKVCEAGDIICLTGERLVMREILYT